MLHANRYELLRDKSKKARDNAKEKRKEKKEPITLRNMAIFSSQKEYMDWYRKQSGDVKADHKLDREGGKLVATWGKKEKTLGKTKEIKVTVSKQKTRKIPPEWTGGGGTLLTNADQVRGGIIDSNMASGKWFGIPHDDNASMVEGFNTREEAYDALIKELDRVQKADKKEIEKPVTVSKKEKSKEYKIPKPPEKLKTKSSLNQLFEKYYSATEKPEKAAYAKLARAKFLEENPGSNMKDYLKAARDAKPSEDEKPKTDVEEKENRSKAMVGNQNAYKGGPEDEKITKKLEQELKTDPVLKGMAISIDLIKTGKSELIGRSVKDPAEMAAIAQVFRDPRFETFRYVLTKGDEINAHLAVTSRMPARTLIAPGKSGETNSVDWLTSKMKEYGADGYYLIHNHPSGDPDPSSQDVSITGKLQKNVKGYRGHIIINSNKYASLEVDKFGEITKEIKDLNGKQDEFLKPSIEHPLLGKKINSQDALAAISKDLQNTSKYFTLIGADNKLFTRTILEVPKEMIKNTPEARKEFESFLRSHTRETGANHYFMAGVTNNAVTRNFLSNANHHGLITDASFDNKEVLSEMNTKVVPDERFSDLPKQELTGYLAEEKRKTKSIVVPKEKEIDYSKVKVGREDYQEKKESRIERLESRAAKAEQESDSRYKKSKELADRIPFGQPILVGHHSEKRARRDQEKIHADMGRSVAASKKAEVLKDRVKAAESNRAISSDDPEAVVKLKEKLDKLEKFQEDAKKINAAWRKFKKNPSSIDKSDLSDKHKKIVKDFVPQYSFDKGPIPSYSLTNNNANIRNTKKRLDGMVASAGDKTKVVYEKGDVKITDNVEKNRIQVSFPGKPDQETRSVLKANGFKWAPSEDAWQRKRSPNARYVTKNFLIKELEALQKTV